MENKPSRWRKLLRAEAQSDALHEEIVRFSDPSSQEPIRIRQQFNADEQAVYHVIDFVPEMPADWGLAIGEIIHNLRGALDHLIWDLAIVDTGSEPIDRKGRLWRTQFPICASEVDWESSGIRKMVLPLSDDHKVLVKSRQPFRGWNGSGRHPLGSIEALSNADKHRTHHPALFSMSNVNATVPFVGQDCELVGEMTVVDMFGRPFEADTILFRFPVHVTGDNPQVNVDFKASFHAALEDGWSIDKLWTEVAPFVRETLNLFDSDLTTDMALATRQAIDRRRPPLTGKLIAIPEPRRD